MTQNNDPSVRRTLGGTIIRTNAPAHRVEPSQHRPSSPIQSQGSNDRPGGNFKKPQSPKKENRSFIKRHLILFNFLLIMLAGFILCWLSYLMLDLWTAHGDERTVPDVIGRSFVDGESILKNSDLTVLISDSTYDSPGAPGTIIDQNPPEGARVKNGRTVYLTIVAFSPKMVTVPDLNDVSGQQAMAQFNSLGMHNIDTVMIVAEHHDGLLLEAKVNGRPIFKGDKIPINSHVTLVVGMNPPRTIFDQHELDSASTSDGLIDTAFDNNETEL